MLAVPLFASFILAFALQLRKKHGKTSVRVRKVVLYCLELQGQALKEKTRRRD
jgi:hypothetical protein